MARSKWVPGMTTEQARQHVAALGAELADKLKLTGPTRDKFIQVGVDTFQAQYDSGEYSNEQLIDEADAQAQEVKDLIGAEGTEAAAGDLGYGAPSNTADADTFMSLLSELAGIENNADAANFDAADEVESDEDDETDI